MLWLKACPRCRGDLLRQADIYGSYMACLQCGYILRSDEELRVMAESRPAVREAAKAGKAA